VLTFVTLMDKAWERAVSHGDVEGVQEMLRAGLDIDARNRHGQTALMIAAQRGYGAIVDVLIEARASLDVTAKYRLSALMLAVVAGHDGIARRLASAGADLSIRGTGAPGFAGKTAHDLAVERAMAALVRELSGNANDRL
jgi:uncharacterized protein